MALESKLKQLELINDKTNHLVYGYNREMKCKLGNYKLFENIPSMVHSLCMLFYYQMEQFEIYGDDLKCSIYNTSITGLMPIKSINYQTAYGKFMIASTKKFNGKWTIKLNKCRQGMLAIGITSKVFNNGNKFDYDTSAPYYAYNGFCGYKWDKGGVEQFGQQYRTNDIIKMHLIIDDEENQQQLSFYKNDEYLGVAFDDIETGKDIAYRLVLWIQDQQDQVTITDFEFND